MTIKLSDNRKKLVFKEPMITLKELLQRWTGIKPYELKKIVGETKYYSKEDRHTHGDTTPLFRYNIHPYCIDKILEDGDGKYIYYCRLANWVTVEGRLGGLDFGYHVGFKIAEIEHYEKKYPEVLYKIKESSPVAEVAPSSPLPETGRILEQNSNSAAAESDSVNTLSKTEKIRKKSKTRRKNTITHAVMAKACGVSKSLVSKWESGKKNPPYGYPRCDASLEKIKNWIDGYIALREAEEDLKQQKNKPSTEQMSREVEDALIQKIDSRMKK